MGRTTKGKGKTEAIIRTNKPWKTIERMEELMKEHKEIHRKLRETKKSKGKQNNN